MIKINLEQNKQKTIANRQTGQEKAQHKHNETTLNWVPCQLQCQVKYYAHLKGLFKKDGNINILPKSWCCQKGCMYARQLLSVPSSPMEASFYLQVESEKTTTRPGISNFLCLSNENLMTVLGFSCPSFYVLYKYVSVIFFKLLYANFIIAIFYVYWLFDENI